MEQNDYLKMSENGKTVFSCKKDYEGTVVIPEGVTWIRDDAFVGCTNLKEILVDENNLDYCSKDGVLYSKLMSILFVVPCCKDSIEIPEYVLVIKDLAFHGCSNLKSITIPDSVSVIGNHTFRDCTNLKEILVDEKNPNYCSWDGALYAKDRKTLIAIPYGKDSIEIPDGVAEISDNAFEGCKSLTSIEIPSSVTKIGWVAFHGCTSLKSITIPEGVAEISDNAFEGCKSLTSIEIPSSVTKIGWVAFHGCTSLKSITIPEGVPVIWAGTFQGCTSLISITIPSSVATIQSWAFRRCTSLKEIHLKHKNPKNFAEAFKDIDPSNVTIYVPKGSVKAYRNSIHYKSFKAIIEEE